MPKAELVKLDFATLSDLDDGTIARLLGWHLQCISRDLRSRPWEKKARTVTLALSFTPHMTAQGELSKASLEIDAKRGRASLGTEITGAVEGTILELPNMITLSVLPFTDRALQVRSNVRCEIELLVAAQRIQVIPDQRDLDTMRERTMDEIAELLDKNANGVRTIYGTVDGGSHE